MARRFLPTDRPETSAARQPGRDRLVLFAPSLTGILLGLSQLSEDGGIGHPGVLVPLLAGIALLAAFIAWASRPGEHQPVVDKRLLRMRSLGSASAVLFTAGAAMYAAMSCCRSTTSNCGARVCWTPGCCSFRKGSALSPHASWSAGWSTGSERAP
jgi:hypothetical protein